MSATAEAVARRKAQAPSGPLEARAAAAPAPSSFHDALAGDGISLIAEMKRASPSQGPIRPGASVTDVLRAYVRGGASASSVLTEGEYFGGTLADLEEARGAVDIPLLRKDFIVDEYQLLEARSAGADAVLLIVAGLSSDRLVGLLGAARELGMDALVETHSADEVEVAIASGADIVGINNRNLHTLEVDVETSFRLLDQLPDGVVSVAESGITGRPIVERLEEAGANAILVGESLMRAVDPAAATRELLGRGG